MFYVYEHWRPDTNTCFYVGKGKKRRAWSMKGRNRHHTSIVSKLTALGLCVDVRIVATELALEAAYTLEVARIQFYGRANLANLTAGGEGGSEPNSETRELIGRASRARLASPEAKERHGATRRGKPSTFKGRKHSPEAIIKLSLAAKRRGPTRTGAILSEETKAKISAARKGKPGSKAPKSVEHRAKLSVAVSRAIKGPNNPFWGCKHTTEAKARMSLAKRKVTS